MYISTYTQTTRCWAFVPPPILRWLTRGPAGPGRAPRRSLRLLEFLRRLYRSLLGSFGVCFGVPGGHFCMHSSPMGTLQGGSGHAAQGAKTEKYRNQ